MKNTENHLTPPLRLHHALKRLRFSYEHGDWKGIKHRYPFRCSNGHLFLATAESVCKLVDCTRCKDNRRLERLATRMRLAGMELMDTAWSGTKHRYRMRCAQGHELVSGGNDSFAASCRLCIGDTLLKKLAAKINPYGVTLVSNRWRGKTAWYQTQCAKGHEQSVRGDILTGKPCKKCAGEQLLQSLAATVQRNGWLLVDNCWQSKQHHYRLRCVDGHVALYRYYTALVCKICRVCAQQKRAEASRARAHLVAAENAIARAGFRFMGRRKVGDEVFFQLQCPKNHLYRLPGHAVFVRRFDCVVCAGEQAQTERTRSRLLLVGIKLLDVAWAHTGTSSQQLECSKGHVWDYRPGRDPEEIPRCVQCANITDSEKLVANATAGGITWLDTKWNGPFEPHAFRCALGHAWSVAGALATHALECPRCQQLKQQENTILQEGLARFESALKHRGGKCLGPSYTGAEESYRLRCSDGHEWQGTARSVIRGEWCERCTGPNPAKPKGMARLRLLAGLRGGVCLANQFIDNHTYYRFRCAENHEWQSRPEAIKQGTWCRRCANAKRLALTTHS